MGKTVYCSGLTFAGLLGYSKLAQQSPELLPHSCGSLQPFVIEEVLLAPLRAPAILPETEKGTQAYHVCEYSLDTMQLCRNFAHSLLRPY